MAAIFGALGTLHFWLGSPEIYRENQLKTSPPHLYSNSSVSIAEIRLFAFYFIPKNKKGSAFSTWKETLTENLEKLQKFHDLQFQGRSKISFEIYPEPVIGLKDNIEYDTDDTNRGNAHALLNIAEEINNRALIAKSAGAYPVLFILYEGVGASGGIIQESGHETKKEIAEEIEVPESLIYIVDITSVDGFFLLGRSFLSNQSANPNGATILGHEFYHTLGIEDSYDQTSELATTFSPDIMGSGRLRRLENTYISRETLKNLGF